MSARYLSQRFAQELTAWSGTDKLPQSANQDVRYGLELQAKRMKDRGLLMEYELLPPKNRDAGIHRITNFGMGKRKSSKYESRMEFINYIRMTAGL